MLPCPLWGDCRSREAGPPRGRDDEDILSPGADSTPPDARKRFATREQDDGGKGRDPFVLNRFEKILAMAEMVNVDRPADDGEDEDARKAADDLEELAIGRRSGKPATRLKFDPDLPPDAVDARAARERAALSGVGLSQGVLSAGPLPRAGNGGFRNRRRLGSGRQPPAGL